VKTNVSLWALQISEQHMCALISLVILAAVSSAAADDGKPKEAKPETAATILEKKLSGEMTVEFLVEEVHTLKIDSLFKPGTSEPQILRSKKDAGQDEDEFWVIVHREPATELVKMGIADPAEHFRGKVVRISGTVERVTNRLAPGKDLFKLQVTGVAQLKSVKPAAVR
jgi:hypothetical protein